MSATATLLAVVELANLANTAIALYATGEITEEQLDERHRAMKAKLDAANARWENTPPG